MKSVIKGNIIFYFALLAVVIATMISIKRCTAVSPHTTRDYKEIADDTLRIIINDFDYDNIIDNYNYNMAVIIADESGLKYKIDTINSINESISQLKLKNYDIIAHPIFTTTKYKNEINFIEGIYLKQGLVVIQRNEGKIRNSFDLYGKKVITTDDEGIKMIIDNLSFETGDSINIIQMHNISSEQLIAMVADSTIDYAICGAEIAKKMKRIIPNINIGTQISIPIPQGWGVRQTSPILADSINAWLNRVKKSNKYKELVNKK